jgi:hypothetical protein
MDDCTLSRSSSSPSISAGFHPFRTEERDDDLIFVIFLQMLHCSRHRTQKTRKFPLQGFQLSRIVGEVGPVFLLPIPGHDEV